MNFKFDVVKCVKDTRNRNVAKRYDAYDAVEYVKIDEVDEFYYVDSKVNVLNDIYHVEFMIDPDGDPYDFKCDCIFCEDDSPCGHVGAVLYLLNRIHVGELPFEYDNSYETRLADYERRQREREERERQRRMFNESVLFNQFIDNAKKNYMTKVTSMAQNEKYSLVPVIECDDYDLTISYKVGNDKLYVIKQIYNFLNRYKKKESYKYGKFLEFVHDENAFNETALKHIAFMERCNEIYSRTHTSYYGYATLDRDITIDDDNIDIFYDTFKELELKNIEFHEIEGRPKLTIKEHENLYEIGIDFYYTHASKQYFYAIEVDKKIHIFRLLLDPDGKCMHFIQQFYSGSIYVQKENYQNFLKYVLAPIASYFDIDKEIGFADQEYHLIKIYGDVSEEDGIYFKIYYYNEDNDRIQAFNNDIQNTYQQDIVEEFFKTKATFIDEAQSTAYFSDDDEKTYEFINEGLDILREYGEIYVSDALKRIGKSTHYHINVGVRVSNDLLHLDIDSVEIPKMEVAAVLDSYKRKKKFYRLKNGQLIHLDSKELDELAQITDQYHISTKDMKNGSIALNKNRAFSLENDMDHYESIQFERKQSYQKLLDNFDMNAIQNISISENYDAILRDYQKEGVKWMKTLHQLGFNGILGDDMGLGKTLQVIALIDELHDIKPSLVVCPASLIYNWQEEVHKFSQTLNVIPVVGNINQRKEILQSLEKSTLYITSYDYLRRDEELYENHKFSYVILDESQYIKNQNTKSAQAVKKLKADHRLALSGTPIENSLAELWSIFDFLMPQYLFNYHYFKGTYETEIVKNKNEEVIQKLQRLVSPFILRRNKKDVLTELPDKVESVMTIPFTQKESELYFASLSQASSELAQLLNAETTDSMKVLALLTRLRQICLEPRMIYENIHESSSKLKAAVDLVNNYRNNNQKVLLFSAFTSMFDFLEEEFKLLGIRYFKLTGSTSKEKRKDLVTRFQNGEADVFLISLKAGGTGLNLTAAEAVIHIDPWWNVSAQNQATDRAYRIGQHKNVQVHKLIMKDSIEEKILKLQEKKKELADLFVENNTGSLSTLSKDDIRSLFE